MRKLLLAALLLLDCNLASPSQMPPDEPAPGSGQRLYWLKEVLRKPKPAGERARNLTFEQLVLGAQPDEEHQPQRDPLLPNPPKEHDPFEMPVVPLERKSEPSFVASDLCGMIVLATGLIGWIVLGVAVVIVERKQSKPA
jgi:hypothetical protein